MFENAGKAQANDSDTVYEHFRDMDGEQVSEAWAAASFRRVQEGIDEFKRVYDRLDRLRQVRFQPLEFPALDDGGQPAEMPDVRTRRRGH